MCKVLSTKSVSGVWVRLLEDNSRYDVRYVNNATRRMWHLVIGKRSTWALMAKGVEYDDMLRGMKAGQYDAHGWVLVPESDYETLGFKVSVPSPLYARRVSGMVLNSMVDRGWSVKGEDYVSDTVYSYPVPSDDTITENAIEADYEDSYVDWDDESYTPTEEELQEYYADMADSMEPAPVTQEIPEVPPATNSDAHVVATSSAVRELVIPACVPLRDVPGCAEYPKHKWVLDSKRRKIGYVLWGAGVCIAYRDWYVRGSDPDAESAAMQLALSKAA